MITKESLEGSLFTVLEFGYKCCERNMNIQAAISAASPQIKELVEKSGLKHEIIRISSKPKK